MKDKDLLGKPKLLKTENEHLGDKNLYYKFYDDYDAEKWYNLKDHIKGLV